MQNDAICDTTHIEISAPHHKCTALKYANESMQFGTQLTCLFCLLHTFFLLELYENMGKLRFNCHFNKHYMTVLTSNYL